MRLISRRWVTYGKIGNKPLTARFFIVIFTNLKLCLAEAIHNFKWVKIIQIDKMDVNDFEILLIYVTFG